MTISVHFEEGDVTFPYIPANAPQTVIASNSAVEPVRSDFLVLVVRVTFSASPFPALGPEILDEL